MEEDLFGFEKLLVWKLARKFKQEIIRVTNLLPGEEKYRLKDQFVRSSRSINALIAEGYGRFSYPDQIHFCIQARGSLNELVNHLIDMYDEKFISEDELKQLNLTAKQIERLLNGYIIFLRNKKTALLKPL